jgi:hypothetical protein
MAQCPVGDGAQAICRLNLLDGGSRTAGSLADLSALLASTPSADVMSLRVDISAKGDSLRASVVASPREPGLLLLTQATKPAESLGIAQLAFRAMMVGYVDRLGGWRAPLWMATALAPLLLVSIGVSPGHSPIWGRIALIVAGIFGSIAAFALSFRRFQVPAGFELLDSEPEARGAFGHSLRRIAAHRWTRRLAATLGAVLVGAVGSKLATVIPWP